MTSHPTRQLMTKDLHAMTPDHLSDAGRRIARFIRGHWPDNTSKRLEDLLDCSPSTAERVLAGRISMENLNRLFSWGGWRFAHYILTPLCGPLSDTDAELAFLDAIDHDAFSAFSAAGLPLRTNDDLHDIGRSLSGGDRDRAAVAGPVVGTPWSRPPIAGRHHRASWLRSVLDTAAGTADDLKALRGAVDLNEEIGLDAVAEPQAILLDAWGASGGELSDSLIGAIDGAGLSGLASVFDNQMRVRRIGPAVGFWNAEQRLDAVGRDMGELPAPLPYLQAVRESLQESAGQGIALHHRIKVRVGDVTRTYRRLALPCSRSGLVLSVSMLEAA